MQDLTLGRSLSVKNKHRTGITLEHKKGQGAELKKKGAVLFKKGIL